MQHNRHRPLRPRHRHVVSAERLLLGPRLPLPRRVRELAHHPRHLRARIGQDPAVADERTLRLRIDRIVLVERQHHVVETKSLRAVDRHDPHLARLRHVAFLLGREKAREVRESHSGLKPKLEFRRGAKHVRKTRLSERAPRLGRLLGKTRTQLTERADDPLRRKGQRELTGNLRHLRDCLPVLRLRERRTPEVLIGLLVAGMVRQRERVDEHRERGRVEDGALAFPHDALESAALQLHRQKLAEPVRPHEHRGGNAALHRIDRLERVEDRLDEILRLRPRRLDGLHEPAELRLRRLMLRRLPARELVLQPPVDENRVDRLHDRLAVAPRLLELVRRIRPALALPREDPDVSVAPAVDRLFAVTNDED